jgi:hypothetical protein
MRMQMLNKASLSLYIDYPNQVLDFQTVFDPPNQNKLCPGMQLLKLD